MNLFFKNGIPIPIFISTFSWKSSCKNLRLWNAILSEIYLMHLEYTRNTLKDKFHIFRLWRNLLLNFKMIIYFEIYVKHFIKYFILIKNFVKWLKEDFFSPLLLLHTGEISENASQNEKTKVTPFLQATLHNCKVCFKFVFTTSTLHKTKMK